jgi:hypothetical protein
MRDAAPSEALDPPLRRHGIAADVSIWRSAAHSVVRSPSGFGSYRGLLVESGLHVPAAGTAANALARSRLFGQYASAWRRDGPHPEQLRLQ